MEREPNERGKGGLMIFAACGMVLCCALAIGFIVYEMRTAEIAPGVLAVYNMAIGALLKMLGDAFQFEFGSSRGSKEKDLLRAK